MYSFPIRSNIFSIGGVANILGRQVSAPPPFSFIPPYYSIRYPRIRNEHDSHTRDRGLRYGSSSIHSHRGNDLDLGDTGLREQVSSWPMRVDRVDAIVLKSQLLDRAVGCNNLSRNASPSKHFTALVEELPLCRLPHCEHPPGQSRITAISPKR